MNSYVLMYKEASSTGSFEEVTEISQQGYTVENLEPYTEYIFQVAAVNAIGRGRPSTETRERTGELGKWHRVEKKQGKQNQTLANVTFPARLCDENEQKQDQKGWWTYSMV